MSDHNRSFSFHLKAALRAVPVWTRPIVALALVAFGGLALFVLVAGGAQIISKATGLSLEDSVIITVIGFGITVPATLVLNIWLDP